MINTMTSRAHGNHYKENVTFPWSRCKCQEKKDNEEHQLGVEKDLEKDRDHVWFLPCLTLQLVFSLFSQQKKSSYVHVSMLGMSLSIFSSTHSQVTSI